MIALAIAGMLVWCASVAWLTRTLHRLARRGATADELADAEYRIKAEQRISGLASPLQRAAYRDAAIAIRGPTTLAEREVAQVLADQKF